MEVPTTLEALELRIKAILPEQYQECYEEVQPVSMGSAGLKYGPDGRVAWNEIWGSFCDLAMAGGPPHKGTLLAPGTPEEIAAEPGLYKEIVDEICRGIELVASLPATPSTDPGWVCVSCSNEAEAAWLTRAIVMENVSARCEGAVLLLPAGPNYRVEKEVKNVITSIAKTYHYWDEHMWSAQQREIAGLFRQQGPLLQPALNEDAALRARIAAEIQDATGLEAASHLYTGWLGLQCPDVHSAIWLMRALVASAVLARRQETVLFVPVSQAVVQPLTAIHGLAKTSHVL